MDIFAPGSLVSRVSALSLAAVAVLLVVLLLIAPLYSAWRKGEDRIDQRGTLLSRLEGQALTLKQSPLAKGQKPLDQHILLTSKTRVAATSELQGTVSAVFDAAALTVNRLSFQPSDKPVGSLHPVSVSVQTRGPLDALQRAIHTLESGSPRLRIVDASLRRVSPPRLNMDIAPKEDEVRLLTAEFTILGYWTQGSAISDPVQR